MGAVTGTVLSFELGLLWPEMMRRFGDAFGIGFAIEGLFFFLEAIFIAIYIYGWERLPGWAHFWSGIPIVIAGVGGAASVIAANSWMNTPQGFELGADGRVTDVDVSQVLLNPAFGHEVPHMWLAAYMVTGFLVASVYAVGMLRGRRDRYHRLGFLIPFTVAAAITPMQLFVGDIAAREVYDDQPVKFAAMECVYETGDDQPEHIGGICTDDEVKYAISIDGLDSLLAGFSTGTVVQGLEEFPDDEEPPSPTMLHLSFDTMVGIGSALLLLGAWFGFVLVAPPRAARHPLVPPGRRPLGGRRGPRARVRLDRHRGRPPAVDRPRLHADRGGGDRRGGPVVGLRRDGHDLRRRRDGRRAHAACLRPPLARTGRGGARRAVRAPPAGSGGGGPMSKPDAVAAILTLGVTAYAVFAGADFGAGMWDLLARGTRGDRARAQIDSSIAPVWEANHVWLIFVLVVAWTAFPPAFSAVMTTLYIPLALAALGIVLRGSGFAFRHALPGPLHDPATRVFGVSSVLTPFFMGTVVGAIASGEVPADGDGDPTSSWTGLLPLLTGAMFVAAAAYLAAVFLVRDAGASGDEELQRYFARRALAAAVVAGAAALAGIFALHADAEFVYDGLTDEGCRW